MEDNDLSFKNLRKIQQMEKNSPVLTELRPSFYVELFDYIVKLNKRLEKESSSQKEILLKDEIQNTKKIASNIYEQREKKIILAAVSKARSGKPNLDNMLKIEKNLFDNVLNLLVKSRADLFNKKIEKDEKEKELKKNDTKNEITVKVKKEKLNSAIRITKTIPEFIGTDSKRYNLRKDDILTIPENMSEMLIKRNVAEKIKW